MVEEDKPCDEIILQLAAVEGTVNKLAKIILKEHLNNCVKESIMQGETDILDNFNSLLDKYIK
jgi:DNA-binding FrmR family transcriptional regulator